MRWIHLISCYNSSIDRTYMTMTLLWLLRSWSGSIVCWIWAICHAWNFLLTATQLILIGMKWTYTFAIRSGLSIRSTHTHILLLLYTTLIAGYGSILWLILIFFKKLLVVTWRVSSSIQLLLIPSLLFFTRIMWLNSTCTLSWYWLMFRSNSGGWSFHHSSTTRLILFDN